VKQKKPLPKDTVVLGLVVFGALLLAVVGYMLLVKPLASQLSDTKSQIATAQKTIALYKSETAANKPSATPKIRVADIYRLARAMPSDFDMADVLLELNNVAVSSGAVIDGVSPGAPTVGNGFQVLPIQVLFHGDFYQLTDFLYRLRTLVNVRHGQLEAGGRLFSVESLTLAPQTAGHDLTATVGLDTFVYCAGTTAVAAAPAAAPASTDTSSTATTPTPVSTSAEGAP
jgi:Tfp pilus assembly protein PilO